MFVHLVLTRFNVRLEESAKSNLRCDTDYLNGRLELFEKYCFPSVAAQTCNDFYWLVFFDPDTPPTIKKRIEGYTSRFSRFIPVYIRSMNEYPAQVNNFIQQVNTVQHQFVITSRVDNDDAFHENMVKNIQEYFRPTDMFLNVLNGYIWSEKENIMYVSRQKLNPFVTRIEQIKDQKVQTVWEVSHRQVKHLAPVHNITSFRGWVQVVHGSNILNAVGGTVSFPVFHTDFRKYHILIDTKTSIRKYVNAILISLFGLCHIVIRRLTGRSPQ